MSRITYGDILVMHLDNPYHEWLVRDLARRRQYPIRKIEVNNVKDIKSLQYGSFMANRELIWLVVKKPIYGFVEQLAKVNTTRRVFAIEINDRGLAKSIVNINSRRLHPVVLRKVKTFEDKRDTLRKMLKRWGASFDAKRTENLLIRLMIAHEDTWDDVRITVELIFREGRDVTQKDIEEMYPDDEIYRLQDWILRVLQGNVKKKSYTIADYYLDSRNYSVAWLIRKFRDEVINLSMVYQAYRRGVLSVPISKEKLNQRLEAAGWTDGYLLSEMKQQEQERYLNYVKTVDYKLFVQIEQVVFSGEEFCKHPSDLYRIFEGVRDIFQREGKKVGQEWKPLRR